MLRKLALLLAPFALLLAATVCAAPAFAANLIAPASICPDQDRLDAAVSIQEQSMLCMVNFARSRSDEGPLEDTPALEESARDKSRDIFECDSFSHYACGREFTYWIRASGYTAADCWNVGENLAWGTAEYGGVRSIFRAWMRSPEHRANILGDYSQTGIDLRSGTLDQTAGTRVWTQHFGSRC